MSAPDVLPAWEPGEGAARARALFTEAFGGEAAGVWSAPGRVNVIGEHTDYNGGLALPIALPHRTFLAVRPREDRTLRLVSSSAHGAAELDLDAVGPVGSPAEVTGWPAYVAGVAWAMEQPGGPAQRRRLPGADIAVVSCVPSGGGLSSSAALECAAAIAWDEIAGLGLIRDAPDGAVSPAEVDAGRAVLAALCVRAENEVAGAPTGGMDQAASLRAHPGRALLLDCRDGAIEHVPFDLAAAGLELLVIDTRAKHSHVDGGYGQRRATCEEAVGVLQVRDLREVADDVAAGATLEAVLERLETEEQRKRVRHVVTEIQRVRELADLLRSGGLTAGGPASRAALAEMAALLDDSHVSMRDDYEISCPELDLAVSAAQSAGAHGARMTGGGFGGSAIAVVDAADAARVRAEIARAFEEAGFTAPGFLPAVAASPASRVD